MTGTLKLLQERGETFRDRLVGGIVFSPEPMPEFAQHDLRARMLRRSDWPDLRCTRWLLPTNVARGVLSNPLDA